MAAASKFGNVLASSTTQASIDLEEHVAYAVSHNGETVGGVADADIIVLSPDGAATADKTAEAGKIILHANQSIVLPAGFTRLYYESPTALPSFQLMPCETVRNYEGGAGAI